MSNELLSSACEVDICGVLGMHALQLASETPSRSSTGTTITDPIPNKAVCFHCSNLPKHFFRSVKMDFQEIIAGTVGKENTFGTCVGLIKSEKMSFARFSTDDTARKDARLRRRRPIHRRSTQHLRRRRRRRNPAHAKTPALHLRDAASNTTLPPIFQPSPPPSTRPPRAISAGNVFPRQRQRSLLMAIVAGVDFGTLSVRVSLVDSERGCLSPPSRNILCIASTKIPNTPRNLTTITCAPSPLLLAKLLKKAGISGDQVEAIALDTTGSSCNSRRQKTAAPRRILSVVRSPRQRRSRRNHRSRAP